MGWIITLIVGALIGWIASLIMKTDAQQGTIANILVGIVGSALGKWIFADLLGIGSAFAAGRFSPSGLIFGVLGRHHPDLPAQAGRLLPLTVRGAVISGQYRHRIGADRPDGITALQAEQGWHPQPPQLLAHAHKLRVSSLKVEIGSP